MKHGKPRGMTLRSGASFMADLRARDTRNSLPPRITRLLVVALVSVFTLAPLVARAQTPQPSALVLGVLPNLPAPTLLEQYQHMKRFLERSGAYKIQVATAANFKAFYSSAVRGDYDVAVMAVHLARLAQRDAGLIPLAVFEPPMSAVLVSTPNHPIADADALRGKSVGFANPDSLVAMYGLTWIGRAGLVQDKDFQIRGQRTDLGVGRMLLTGEISAAILSDTEFRQLPAHERARLKVTAEIARIPNFVIVAHPRLVTDRIAKLREELRAFISDKESGQAFMKATGVTGVADVDEELFKAVDPFLARTRAAMSGGK
jgi:ABC-type phosphate/phosphonate transport system substrate-binding protein